MKTVSTSEMPALTFRPSQGQGSVKYRSQSNRIGWLQSIADKPGARFDITIKDSLGRIKMQKLNCGNDTEKYGELLNFPTLIGEELEVEVSNLKGAEEVSLMLN